jgi:hypothetical protein
MMATATSAATMMTFVIAVAPAHALVVLSVSHDCLSLTPVSGGYCRADSFTQLQATLPTALLLLALFKRLAMTGR